MRYKITITDCPNPTFNRSGILPDVCIAGQCLIQLLTHNQLVFRQHVNNLCIILSERRKNTEVIFIN